MPEEGGKCLNILMVTMGMNIGGAETHIVELAAALVANGNRVTVASAGGVYEAALSRNGVPHVTLPLDKKSPGALLAARRGLAALLRKENFDIVHAHARIPAFVCGSLQKKFGFRFVTTCHGVFRLSPILKRLSDWGEYTFVVSDDIRQYLLQNYDLNPAHIISTVNGINTEVFSPLHDGSAMRKTFPGAERPTLLHVSRLERESSVCAEALLEAVQILGGKVRLIIVGDGAYAGVLRQKAEQVNDNVGEGTANLVGAKTNVVDYIAACDIFVGPSRAAMEAMSCAKPTIISGSEGHGGIFSSSIEAAALASNFCFRGAGLPTPERLAHEIEILLSYGEEEKKRVGIEGRECILRHYSVEKMVSSYLSVYEKITAYKTDVPSDVVICGYYGYGNAGDDSLLSRIVDGIRRIRPSIGICVMSAHPKKTRRFYLVDAVNRFRLFAIRRKLKEAKLFLFGGGNLLQDKTSTHSLLYYTKMLHEADRCKTPIMVFANGIGPLSATKNIYRVKEALSLAESISLRDGYSFDFTKQLLPEKNIRLTFDPAIQIHPVSIPLPEKPYFIIFPKKNAPDAADKLIYLTGSLQSRQSLTPYLISLYDEEDLEYCRRLSERTGAVLLRPHSDVEIVSLLAGAELAVSSRLHGLIYATAAVCPMMSFSDDGKLASYLDYIGFGRHAAIPCTTDIYTDAEYLLMAAERILLYRDKIRTALRGGLPMWQTLAEYEFSEAVRLIQEAPAHQKNQKKE